MKVATLAQGGNPVAKLTAIGSPIIAASRLAVTLAEMFNAVTVPDDDAECAKWLDRIPTEAEMNDTIAMLDRALTQRRIVRTSASIVRCHARWLWQGGGRKRGHLCRSARRIDRGLFRR